ncbi:hypothetical protein KFE25_002446 [Diacronema lutheri]|uniref:Uncharacterized protein n=1 Tax=Diacronema lutheri TaxID=2081491 RepID=A0A8J6C406_DIALT|nr:hypothetical protein KFE25_002446 [Diacronema lutheri]
MAARGGQRYRSNSPGGEESPPAAPTPADGGAPLARGGSRYRSPSRGADGCLGAAVETAAGGTAAEPPAGGAATAAPVPRGGAGARGFRGGAGGAGPSGASAPLQGRQARGFKQVDAVAPTEMPAGAQGPPRGARGFRSGGGGIEGDAYQQGAAPRGARGFRSAGTGGADGIADGGGGGSGAAGGCARGGRGTITPTSMNGDAAAGEYGALQGPSAQLVRPQLSGGGGALAGAPGARGGLGATLFGGDFAAGGAPRGCGLVVCAMVLLLLLNDVLLVVFGALAVESIFGLTPIPGGGFETAAVKTVQFLNTPRLSSLSGPLTLASGSEAGTDASIVLAPAGGGFVEVMTSLTVDGLIRSSTLQPAADGDSLTLQAVSDGAHVSLEPGSGGSVQVASGDLVLKGSGAGITASTIGSGSVLTVTSGDDAAIRLLPGSRAVLLDGGILLRPVGSAATVSSSSSSLDAAAIAAGVADSDAVLRADAIVAAAIGAPDGHPLALASGAGRPLVLLPGCNETGCAPIEAGGDVVVGDDFSLTTPALFTDQLAARSSVIALGIQAAGGGYEYPLVLSRADGVRAGGLSLRDGGIFAAAGSGPIGLGGAAEALSLVGGALTVQRTVDSVRIASGAASLTPQRTELLAQPSAGAAIGGTLALRGGDAGGAGAGGALTLDGGDGAGEGTATSGAVIVGRASSSVRIFNGACVGSLEGGLDGTAGPADAPLRAGEALGVVLGGAGGGSTTVAGELLAQGVASFAAPATFAAGATVGAGSLAVSGAERASVSVRATSETGFASVDVLGPQKAALVLHATNGGNASTAKWQIAHTAGASGEAGDLVISHGDGTPVLAFAPPAQAGRRRRRRLQDGSASAEEEPSLKIFGFMELQGKFVVQGDLELKGGESYVAENATLSLNGKDDRVNVGQASFDGPTLYGLETIIARARFQLLGGDGDDAATLVAAAGDLRVSSAAAGSAVDVNGLRVVAATGEVSARGSLTLHAFGAELVHDPIPEPGSGLGLNAPPPAPPPFVIRTTGGAGVQIEGLVVRGSTIKGLTSLELDDGSGVGLSDGTLFGLTSLATAALVGMINASAATVRGAALRGGALDGCTIGASERAPAAFSMLRAATLAGDVDASAATVSGATLRGGALDGVRIGAMAAAAGNFTELGASTLRLDVGLAADLDARGFALTAAAIVGGSIDGAPIGATARAAGAFQSLVSRGAIVLDGAGDAGATVRRQSAGDLTISADDGGVLVEGVRLQAGSLQLPTGGTLSAAALAANLDVAGFELGNAVLRNARLVGVTSLEGDAGSAVVVSTIEVATSATVEQLGVVSGLAVYASGATIPSRRGRRLQDGDVLLEADASAGTVTVGGPLRATGALSVGGDLTLGGRRLLDPSGALALELFAAGGSTAADSVAITEALAVGGDISAGGSLGATSAVLSEGVSARTLSASSAILAAVLAPSAALVAAGATQIGAEADLALSMGNGGGVALVGSGRVRTTASALTLRSADSTVHLGSGADARPFVLARTPISDGSSDGGTLRIAGQRADGSFALAGGIVIISGGDAPDPGGSGGSVVVRAGAGGAAADSSDPLLRLTAPPGNGTAGADELIADFTRGRAVLNVPLAMGSGGIALGTDGTIVASQLDALAASAGGALRLRASRLDASATDGLWLSGGGTASAAAALRTAAGGLLLAPASGLVQLGSAAGGATIGLPPSGAVGATAATAAPALVIRGQTSAADTLTGAAAGTVAAGAVEIVGGSEAANAPADVDALAGGSVILRPGTGRAGGGAIRLLGAGGGSALEVTPMGQLLVGAATAVRAPLTVGASAAGEAVRLWGASAGSHVSWAADVLHVEGALSAGEAVAMAKGASIGGALGVSGAASFSGPVALHAALTAGNSTGVGVDVTLWGSPAGSALKWDGASGSLQLTGSLDASGAVRLASGATVDGALSARGGVSVTGATVANGALTVGSSGSGHATLLHGASAGSFVRFASDTLTLRGAADLRGAVGLTGDLAVSGTLSVTGSSVALTAPLAVAGTLGVSGAATLGGTLAVGGALTVGTAAAGTNVLVYGAAQGSALQWTAGTNRLAVAGSVAVTGATALTGALSVTGNTALVGTLSATGATTLSSTLGVVGAATVGGALALGGELTVGTNGAGQGLRAFGASAGSQLRWVASSNTLAVNAASIELTAPSTSVAGPLAVSGAMSITGAASVTGAVQLTGALTVGANDVGHDVRLYGGTAGSYLLWDEDVNTLDIRGRLLVQGPAELTGATQLGGSLGVTGATTLTATLAVGGATALSGALTVGANGAGRDVTLFGSSAGSFAAWSNNVLDVVGGLEVSGGAAVGGTLALGGALNVDGAATFDGGATFHANVAVGNPAGGESINAAFYGAAAGSSALWDAGNNRLALAGTLRVTGPASVSAATTLSSTVTIGSTLSVSGATSLFGATTIGQAGTGQTLTVHGSSTGSLVRWQGTTLTVNGATALTGALTVSAPTASVSAGAFALAATGAATLTAASLTLSAPLAVVGATTLTGAASISGTLAVGGALTVGASGSGQTLRAFGSGAGSALLWTGSTNSLAVAGSVAVTGATALTGALSVTGNTALVGTLSATGATTLSSTLGVVGAATVGGALALGGELTVGTNGAGQGLRAFGASAGSQLRWVASSNTLAVNAASIELTAPSTSVAGPLAVSGAMSITGAASVTGAVQLTGALTVGANDVGHDVRLYGGTAGSYLLWDEDVNTLDIRGRLLVSQPASLSNALSVGGSLSVTGATTLTGNLALAGQAVVTGALTLGSASSASSLTIFGSGGNSLAFSGSTLFVTGGVTVTSAALLASAVTVGGTLAVTGAATLSAGAALRGPLTVGVDDLGHDVTFYGGEPGSYLAWDEGASTLSLNGRALQVAASQTIALAAPSTTLASPTISVSGTSLSVSTSTAIISAALTLNGTVAMSGAATLAATLAVAGATSIASTLSVDGSTAFGSAVSIQGATTIFGEVVVNDDLVVEGDFNVGTPGTPQDARFYGTPVPGSTRYVEWLSDVSELHVAATQKVFGALEVYGVGANAGSVTVTGTLLTTGDITTTANVNVGGTASFGALEVSGGLTSSALLSVGASGVGADFVAHGATGGRQVRWTAATNSLAVTATATSIASPLSVTGATTLTGALTVTGATALVGTVQANGAVTVGASGAGHNVRFHGASSGSQLLWTSATNALAVTGSVAVTGTHTITGAAVVTGATTLNGGLSATGAASLHGGATVLGGALTVGSASAPQELRVFGTNTTSVAFAAGALTADAALTVTGGAAFDSAVHVAGALSAMGGATLSGALQLNGALTSGADASGHTLRLFGTLAGSHAEWNAASNTFRVVGTAAVTGSASVSGAATVSGLLRAQLGLAVSGGATSITGGDVDVGASGAGVRLTVHGASASSFLRYSADSLTVGGTAAVTGAVALGGAASVAGVLSANGGLAVTGSSSLAATTVSSTLGVTGAVTLSGATSVQNTLTVGSASNGRTVVMHGIAAGSALTWTASTNTLTVMGAASVSGTVQLSGVSTFRSNVAFDTATSALITGPGARLACITASRTLGFCESNTACTTCTQI